MPKESRTHIFAEIITLEIVIVSIMNNMWILESTPLLIASMLISVLQICNCIRFWRRAKDGSYIDQYPILSNLWVFVSIFSAASFIVLYTTINLYWASTIQKFPELAQP